VLETTNAQTKLTTNVGNATTLNQMGRTNKNPLNAFSALDRTRANANLTN